MVDIKVFAPGEISPEVFAFRYSIYEQEMHRNDAYADHQHKTIRDPQDDFAYNVVGYQKGEVIGVARINVCADGDEGFYGDFYEMREAKEYYPDRVSYSTRLMVIPKERGRVLPLLLTAECFKIALHREIKWNYVDCNAHMVPYFKRLNFEMLVPKKTHPRFGEVSLMRVDLTSKDIYDKSKTVIARYL